MTDIITYENNINNDNNIDNKWRCPKCLKYYSKNYPYKSHLKRCLVHQEDMDNKYDMLGDLMTDLKNELKHDFKNELFKMINEIKDEVKNDVKKINYQPQPKKIIYPF